MAEPAPAAAAAPPLPGGAAPALLKVALPEGDWLEVADGDGVWLHDEVRVRL